MTINIDGSDVTGITIDGTDVTEVTIDGTTVWTPPATTSYIDSFDTWDGTNYTGDIASFERVATPSVSGEAIRATDQFFSEITSTAGLANYPERGDSWEYHIRSNDVTNSCDPYMSFGLQDDDDKYRVRVQMDGDFVRIEKKSAGSFTDLTTGSTSFSYTADAWHRVEVQWDDGSTFGGAAGDINVILHNAAETDSTTVSVNDTEFSSGGVEFAAGQGTTSMLTYFDEAKITN